MLTAGSAGIYHAPEHGRGSSSNLVTRDLQLDEGVVNCSLLEKLNELRESIRNGANHLSLVIATKDRQLVFLGDFDKYLPRQDCQEARWR